MKYNNSRRIIYTPVIIAVSIVLGIYIGKLYSGSQSKTGPNHLFIYPRAEKLNNVINFIESKYVDSVAKEDLVEKTIPKILEELDPHSIYIPAKDFEEMNEPLQGNFSGIGVQFNMPEDTVIVVNTIPNGPSEKVGLIAGDRIVQVDGDTIAGMGMPSNKVVKRLKGPRGTKVVVGIYRPGTAEIVDYEIIRDDIPLYSVDVAYMMDDSTGYMKISKFASTTFQEFQQNYNDLTDQGMKYFILDLRSNSGGYLGEATKIADQFLDENRLIVYTEGKNSPRSEMRASNRGIALNMPTGVLIDETSASASEILAGALQDNDRAVIIGRRSYGKGLVQEPRRFPDGSEIRLTIARYHTPSGRCIQKPYSDDFHDYYNDLNQRYLNGEFLSVDSIHFSDSLKYYTTEGDVVYGGGGIMPDFFIPIDTIGVSNYLSRVRNRGLIYRFAFEYTDKHRKELSELQTLDELLEHLDNENLLSTFVSYAEGKGIKTNRADLKISKEIIGVQLRAYIARNVFDNAGFYPILSKIDNTLLKAATIVKNED